MPVDPVLLEDVRRFTADLPSLEEKRMFGGVGFMWRGNLLCAVSNRGLVVHLTEDDFEQMIGVDDSEPMQMGARTSRTWMRIPPESLHKRQTLEKWLRRAKSCLEGLPSKG